MFGFGKKIPKPSELVKQTKENLGSLEKNSSNPKAAEKITEELSKNFIAIKLTFAGDGEHEPNQDNIMALTSEIFSTDLLVPILTLFPKFDFETRKDITIVYNHLLRRQVGSRWPMVEYLVKTPNLLEMLMAGYEEAEIAKSCGTILRDCCRHETLVKILLLSPNLWKFFKYVEVSNFDVASDAFTTFKEILTKHKTLVAEFLEKHYDQFFENYIHLLNSENYVTRRQSLKLLGELLLDRANFNVMTKYIADLGNLKLVMNLLRDKSKNIQFEAFHVFKVFVANPNKPAPILNILVKNKDKLVGFLSNFQNEKGSDDDQFNDEKAFLVKQIQQLPSQ